MRHAPLLIGIIILFTLFAYMNSGKDNRIPTVKEMITNSALINPKIIPSPLPTSSPLSASDLFKSLNQSRIENKLSPFIANNSLCQIGDIFLKTQSPPSQTKIATICPNCRELKMVAYERHTLSQAIISEIATDASMSAIINSKNLTHACISEQPNLLLITSAKIAKPLPPKATESTDLLSIPVKNISESELWQALAEYRKDHQVPTLDLDENLCIYARSRVAEHIQLLKDNKPQGSYPVPAKYPLDGHSGFKRDADNGKVYEVTKRNLIAENLAYYPTATYATHVIEWGWDASTEGHRETQLSTEYTHACLTGDKGFYVAIFGK